MNEIVITGIVCALVGIVVGGSLMYFLKPSKENNYMPIVSSGGSLQSSTIDFSELNELIADYREHPTYKDDYYTYWLGKYIDVIETIMDIEENCRFCYRLKDYENGAINVRNNNVANWDNTLSILDNSYQIYIDNLNQEEE